MYQEPVSDSRSPTWVQRPKGLGHPLLLSEEHEQESGSKVEGPGSNQCPYGMVALQEAALPALLENWRGASGGVCLQVHGFTALASPSQLSLFLLASLLGHQVVCGSQGPPRVFRNERCGRAPCNS